MDGANTDFLFGILRPGPPKEMATKRSHTKSRLGCRSCKLRKVKCDEQRPVCGNCVKRFPNLTECEFDAIVPGPSKKPSPAAVQAPTPASTTAASPPSSSIQPSSTTSVSIHLPEKPRSYDARLLDLRLFHQWTSCTSKTYTAYLQHEIMNRWVDQLPTWAFTHEFLLDFILALAAVHLWLEDPQSHAEMRSAYLFYIAEAGLKHRNALSSVTRENAEPLFLAAMLTNMQAKIIPLLRSPDEPYELPLQMFRLTSGIVATYDAVTPFIPPADMDKIGNLGPMLYPEGIDLKELSFLPREAKQDLQMLTHVVSEQSSASTGVPDTQSILRRALSIVGSIQLGWAAHEPETWTLRRINMFASEVGKGFVELLAQRNLVAMAILARYFMQLKGREEWFLRGVAEREVLGIAGLVPTEMQWIVAWPVKVITSGGEGEGGRGENGIERLAR